MITCPVDGDSDTYIEPADPYPVTMLLQTFDDRTNSYPYSCSGCSNYNGQWYYYLAYDIWDQWDNAYDSFLWNEYWSLGSGNDCGGAWGSPTGFPDEGGELVDRWWACYNGAGGTLDCNTTSCSGDWTQDLSVDDVPMGSNDATIACSGASLNYSDFWTPAPAPNADEEPGFKSRYGKPTPAASMSGPPITGLGTAGGVR